MSKTPDEIKKGLECCMVDECFGERENCPYTADPNLCVGVMCADVLALIRQLEAERDAAVDGLKKAANEKSECFECKWYNGKNCTHQDYKTICCSHDDKWEWRGVQKEE